MLQFTAIKILYMLEAFLGDYIYLRFCPVHYVQKENLKSKTEPLSLRPNCIYVYCFRIFECNWNNIRIS